MLAAERSASAQTSDMPEPIWMHSGKPVSVNEIRKLLERVIDTKDLQQAMPLKDALKFLQDKLSDNGKKNFRIVVQQRLFKEAVPEAPDVGDSEVKLPPFPKRLGVATALRLMLSKVSPCDAVYRLRAGQIQVTTFENAAVAQLEETVSGTYKDRPLVDVLDDLAQQSGVPIIVDRRVGKQARALVTARLRLGGVPLKTALRLLTDMTDLCYLVRGNTVYVTSPRNAKKFAEEEKRRSQLPLGLGNGPNYGGPLGISVYNSAVDDQWINQRPLRATLEALADQSHASLIIDRRLDTKTKVPVTARLLNGVALDTAVRLLTDMADLRDVQIDGVIYVTTPENALNLEQKLRQEQRKELEEWKKKRGPPDGF
jgi:hypothetical protein